MWWSKRSRQSDWRNMSKKVKIWQNKTVLVTGGTGGIGQAIASSFVNEGANVVVTGCNSGALATTTKCLGIGLDRSVQMDVTKVADCERAIRTVIDRTGQLDLLINSAGMWTEGSSDEATEAEWDRVVDVNLKGTFFMCRYAIPFLEKTGGNIINISSDAGIQGNKEAAIYSASKGGVNLLTKSLALELAPRGIRVNAICPGDVDTPMIEYQANTFGKGDPDGYKRQLLSAYPQNEHARFAKPEEIAALIAFVASPAAAPITGACLPIDFGLTAGS